MALKTRFVYLMLGMIGIAIGVPPANAAGGGIIIDTQHEPGLDCAVELGSSCLASGGTDPNQTLDASQETTAVGLLLPLGSDVPLLSDGSLIIRGDDLAIPNPIPWFVKSHNISAPGATYVQLSSNETEFLHWGYYGPSAGDPSLHHHDVVYVYDSTDRGIKHDRIVLKDVGTDNTDHQVVATSETTCADAARAGAGPACTATLGRAGSEVMDSTPNVRFGFLWETVGAGDDPSLFSEEPVTSQESSPFNSNVWIAAPQLPPSPLPTQGPQPALDTRGTHVSVDPEAEARRKPALVGGPARPSGLASAGSPSMPTSPVVPLAASLALAVLLAALYARIRSREEALGHDHRRRVLDILASDGPRTVQQLGDALRVDRSTALYHVRVLRRSLSVEFAKRDRSTFVLLPGQALPAAPAHHGGRAADELLRILRAAPGPVPRAALHALAGHLPLRKRNQAIRALADAGAIVRGFAGNEETLALAHGSGRAA